MLLLGQFCRVSFVCLFFKLQEKMMGFIVTFCV